MSRYALVLVSLGIPNAQAALPTEAAVGRTYANTFLDMCWIRWASLVTGEVASTNRFRAVFLEPANLHGRMHEGIEIGAESFKVIMQLVARRGVSAMRATACSVGPPHSETWYCYATGRRLQVVSAT